MNPALSPAELPCHFDKKKKEKRDRYRRNIYSFFQKHTILSALQVASFAFVFQDEHCFLFERRYEEQTLRIACVFSEHECQIDFGSDSWSPLIIQVFAKNGRVTQQRLTLPSWGFSPFQEEQCKIRESVSLNKGGYNR